MSGSSHKKIICIVGPTASGKSSLGVWLAKKVNGEIISADSRQVYKNLDIGTGKITKREMEGIKHYMLDVVSPTKVFSAYDFKENVDAIIPKIIIEERLPIIVGGTGFYVDSLIGDVEISDVPPNNKLREKLNKMTLAKLQSLLKKLDPKKYKTIDVKNPVRVIRAIEIAKSKYLYEKKPNEYSALKIGVKISQNELDKKIYKRLLSRVKNGMIREVENLHKRGLSWKRMESLGLEYRFISRYLRGRLSKSEMISKLFTEIRRYSKRQMTWFKRDKSILWLKTTEKNKLLKAVKKFCGR